MKAWIIALFMSSLLGIGICGESQNELEEESLNSTNLTNVELKASKTSIVAYNKTRIAADDIQKEAEKLETKCQELGSPCLVTTLKSLGVFLLEYETADHPSIDELLQDVDLEVGAEDSIIHIVSTLTPNDPKYAEQWYYNSKFTDINSEEGWKEYQSDSVGGDVDGPSVVVAIVDTGIDYTHPDLIDRLWTNTKETDNNGVDDDGNGIIDDYYGADFTVVTGGTGDPIDENSHGTHCAGIIVAQENNNVGIAGVASFTQGKVKVMAVKVLDDNGSGTISGLLAGLNYAIEMGAKFSSHSWGASENIAGNYESVWNQVLQNNLDHLFIAAAGNEAQEIDDNYRPLPCGLVEPNLMCVASTLYYGSISYESNYGEKYVHVMAPGHEIYSTVPGGSYAYMSGTSMSAPMVSGLAALVMTMRKDLTSEEVKGVILANVETNINYNRLVSSKGIIDVGATILALKSKTSTGK